jgi:hypothetical protein
MQGQGSLECEPMYTDLAVPDRSHRVRQVVPSLTYAGILSYGYPMFGSQIDSCKSASLPANKIQHFNTLAYTGESTSFKLPFVNCSHEKQIAATKK